MGMPAATTMRTATPELAHSGTPMAGRATPMRRAAMKMAAETIAVRAVVTG